MHKHSLIVRTLFSFNFFSLSAETLLEHITSQLPLCMSSCVVKVPLNCNKRALIHDTVKWDVCVGGCLCGRTQGETAANTHAYIHIHKEGGSGAAVGGLVR